MSKLFATLFVQTLHRQTDRHTSNLHWFSSYTSGGLTLDKYPFSLEEYNSGLYTMCSIIYTHFQTYRKCRHVCIYIHKLSTWNAPKTYCKLNRKILRRVTPLTTQYNTWCIIYQYLKTITTVPNSFKALKLHEITYYYYYQSSQS